MKGINETKEKSTVQQLREIREKIGIEIQDLNYEQLIKYIEKNTKLHPTRIWQKQG